MSARLPDIETLRAMGFNPAQVDKLLAYIGKRNNCIDRVDAIKKILRKNDRQQFVNRFQWNNLPNDLTGEFIERVLYYKYSGIFFYVPELKSFNFLPSMTLEAISAIGLPVDLAKNGTVLLERGLTSMI